MIARRALLPALAPVLACSLALAPSASAANTRVSISNYAWSNEQVHIDLGEKVIWDWLGPDLAHSVTGVSEDARQWDSDPGTDAPYHRPGYSFAVQFGQPGTYVFQCKLHPFVRGEVIVSDVPGDPSSDPGPQAPLRVDVTKPVLKRVSLARTRIRGAKGVATKVAVSERGTLEAEYRRIGAGGGRTYSGYGVWRTSAGLNHLRLAARWRHFEAKPGRYEAVLRATDHSANTSKPVRRRFAIAAGR